VRHPSDVKTQPSKPCGKTPKHQGCVDHTHVASSSSCTVDADAHGTHTNVARLTTVKAMCVLVVRRTVESTAGVRHVVKGHVPNTTHAQMVLTQDCCIKTDRLSHQR
jgi:hypothetical protein